MKKVFNGGGQCWHHMTFGGPCDDGKRLVVPDRSDEEDSENAAATAGRGDGRTANAIRTATKPLCMLGGHLMDYAGMRRKKKTGAVDSPNSRLVGGGGNTGI